MTPAFNWSMHLIAFDEFELGLFWIWTWKPTVRCITVSVRFIGVGEGVTFRLSDAMAIVSCVIVMMHNYLQVVRPMEAQQEYTWPSQEKDDPVEKHLWSLLPKMMFRWLSRKTKTIWATDTSKVTYLLTALAALVCVCGCVILYCVYYYVVGFSAFKNSWLLLMTFVEII